LEEENARKVIGLDIFGKFPDSLALDSDRQFVQNFEGNGGFGINRVEPSSILLIKVLEIMSW